MDHVAGELMAIKSWMDFLILVTVVIIKRSKVDAIVEARQKNQQFQKEKEQAKLDKFKKHQCDLQDELDQVTAQKEKLARQLNDNDERQTNLLKVAEQLTEKVIKLEKQPLHAQGFMTSSSQNLSNTFGNLVTSFQAKQILTSVNLVAPSLLYLISLHLINGVLMSSHIRPAILITFCYLQSGSQLWAEPSQLSDIWDHHTQSMKS